MKKSCRLACVQGPDLRHVWLGSLCKPVRVRVALEATRRLFGGALVDALPALWRAPADCTFRADTSGAGGATVSATQASPRRGGAAHGDDDASVEAFTTTATRAARRTRH